MKNNLFISLLILFGLFSCKKEETSIQGKVINIITKEPVSDVRVKVCDGFRWVGGDTEDGNCYITYTNEEGNFQTTIESDDAHLYFYKKGYEFNNYQGGSVTGTTWLYAGKHTNKVYEIEPQAGFYPIYCSIQKPIKEHTLVVSFKQNYEHTYDFFYSGQNVSFSGKEPFVSFDSGTKVPPYTTFLNFVGDMYVVYRLRFDRDGQNHEIIDSVFLKQGEIFRDTIYY